MFKTCSKCGKIHPYNYDCKAVKREYNGAERELRRLNAWTKKSKEIRSKALFCEVCIKEGIYNYRDLEVHHIVKLKDDPEGLLDNYNLICICQEHHRMADNNEISADYLSQLAREREEEQSPLP